MTTIMLMTTFIITIFTIGMVTIIIGICTGTLFYIFGDVLTPAVNLAAVTVILIACVVFAVVAAILAATVAVTAFNQVGILTT